MKKNLSSDFRKISIIIFVVAITLSSILSAVIYFFDQQKRHNSYPEIAEQFDSILIYDFTNTEHYAILVGRKILQVGPDKLKKIAALMREDFPETISNIFSWTYFDWINDKGKLVVNSKQGLLYDPIDLANRDYLQKSKITPWKLIIGKPSLGVPSGEYVILSGLGVEDRDGRYVGTFGVEFSIKKIRDKLTDIVNDFNCEFFVIDEEDNILVSSDELMTINNNFFKDKEFSSNGGFLTNPIEYNDDIKIDYILDSKYYPFKVLLGSNRQVILKTFLASVLPKILAINLVAFISIYLLMSLRNRILRPLANLSSMAKGIKVDKAKISSQKSKYEEISQLALSISKIQDFNKMLQDEVTKRTLSLKQALQAKQEFLNNISHEVRTPLQGILGISTELYKRWDKIKEVDKKNYVRIMAESGDRLMQLMGDVLDLSKLEEEKMSFHFKIWKFKDIVEDSIKQIRPFFESKKQISLEVEYKDEIRVKCDRLRMQQVINNLLNNAVKYSEKGVVRIEVKKVKNMVRFSISDEGVGIPKKELELIFQPFIESSKTKTKAGGKGLGLALCKEIISAHKGEIWAENKRKGSVFYFEIPLGES